jgi:uncharacterized FlgJ-related protein
MYYKFDRKSLDYVKVNVFKLSLKIVMIFGIILIGVLLSVKPKPVVNYEVEDNIILIGGNDDFTEEKLIKLIKKLNFKFPHIVLAQAKLESGGYKSKIFKHNNNLFGMREAKVRLNLAEGTERGHAFYNNWRESVMDYALYNATYLSKLKTQEKYFEYLQQYYAESPEYVAVLKNMIKKDKLTEKFKK